LAASLGCLVCGRQEPWVEVTTEADGSYTATLCGHFTFHIAGDDVFQQRQAMLFLRQLEGPGPQRRDGGHARAHAVCHPGEAECLVPHPAATPQPLGEVLADKDWANLLSLTAAEVLTGDLMARIVTVFVTFRGGGGQGA